MKNHQNVTRYLPVWMALLVVFGTSGVLAQLDPDVAKFGYADTIFINGKVVSMDDQSTSTQVGTTYQAIAVKAEKIMKLGTTEEIRSVAGPDTQVFDLEGRTLIPGIIEPHSHMYGRAVQMLDRLGFKYPP